MPPAQVESLLQQAVARHRAGRLEEAARLYARICAAAPRHFDAHHLAGTVALQQGRPAAALDLLGCALRIEPRSPICAMRHGLALMAAGRLAEAEAQLRRLTEERADFAECWDHLARCLKLQDRLEEAVACHRHAVALKPGHAPGWHHYGLTLNLCGRTEEAIACHDRALAADPDFAKAHLGRAEALQQSGRPAEAVAAYDRFLRHEPRHVEARSHRLFALHYLDPLSREELFAEHVAFGRMLAAGPAPAFPHDFTPGRRLRIGVLSPDLRRHSCAYFIEPLLRHLDREQFELCLYHDHFREDAVSARLRGFAAVWRNLVGRSAAEAEALIRADRPDVLIDLAGHTGATCRLPLFARRLAPVQVTYLGYPDTTGVPAIGYRFTDAIADPEGEADAFATEQLVRFAPTAWCYQPPANAPDPVPPPCAAGAGPVIFGCFNNPAKITDATLALWVRLLAAVPDSRLLLKGRGFDGEVAAAEHRARFTRLGLPADRIDLLGRTPGTAGHLAYYHRIDVALDTFPYHGTTTTCEALWMGRPVVTLRGDRHMARVGASLLTAAGRPEWIAATPDEYVRIATALAADRAELSRQCHVLRDILRNSVLMDHRGQAARFGAALRRLWSEACVRAAA